MLLAGSNEGNDIDITAAMVLVTCTCIQSVSLRLDESGCCLLLYNSVASGNY